jgi:hypothetical protein
MKQAVIILLSLATALGSYHAQKSSVSNANVQTFSIDTISDAVFQRMRGKSYPKDCKIPRSELRYLRLSYVDAQGHEHIGEMVCNRLIANSVRSIFQELYRQRYPIGRMQLIDDYDGDDERSMRANNTSCFNYRTVAGSTKLSKHSMGMAIDINPLYNPYVKVRKDGTLYVQPAQAAPYADRKAGQHWTYKLEKGDLCHRLFLKHGFQWGGSWRSVKDYQHFESRLADGAVLPPAFQK